MLYASEHDADLAGLSSDEQLAVLEHSEHGDSRHRALRVVRTDDGTTVWERWDSMLPDGTINPGDMTSFNHYALGAVADWLHRTVAGLAPAAPGYRRLRVAPQPGPGITSAAATHETPYGTASVSSTV